MPHIENLIHFSVIGFGSILYDVENNRGSKKIVLDHFNISGQVFHTFCLPATAAMN